MKITVKKLSEEVTKFFLFFFAYFLISKLCIKYTSFNESLAAIWLTCGFALGFSLLFGKKYLIFSFISDFLMEISLPINMGIRISFFIANILEYTIAYYLIRYLIKERDPLGNLTDTIKMIVSGVLIANLISATISSLGIQIFSTEASSFTDDWSKWFISNFSGYLVVLPMILAWKKPLPGKIKNIVDGYLILFSSIIVNLFVFALEIESKINHNLTFLPFVILFWSAVKLDQRFSTVITSITLLISVFFTVSGKGPFFSTELTESLLVLNVYIFVMTLITLFISVANKNKFLTDKNLTKTQEKYQTLFESSKDAILTLNHPEGIIQNVNKSALALFGSNSKKDLIGKKLCDIFVSNSFIDDYSRENCLEKISKAFKEGSLFFEWLIEKATTEKLNITVLLNRYRFDQENFLQATIRNISSQKKIEAELIKAKEDAEMASQVKSDFLAIMSHEIRTPMNAFLGFINMALDTDLAPDQYEYIKRASETGETLLQIINDILDFSKIESGKMQIEKNEFNLNKLLRKIMNVLSMKAEEKGVHLEIKKEINLEENLIGGEIPLSQILLNLVGNAIKFTEKGEVIINISHLSRSEEEIELLFSVKDTGIGISEEQQNKLFSAFSQADGSTSRKYGGTGLGLIISKRLVEIMDGSICLKSKLGEGSQFDFNLKFKFAKNQPEKTENEEERKNKNDDYKKKLEGKKILLVEDNELNRVIAGVILNKAKINVLIAKNGEEALEVVEKENLDCILMDCYMPVMDGFEATKKIREIEKFKKLPIIALTANALEGDREKALLAGMNEYLTKPIKEYDLFKLVNNCIFQD